MFRRLATRVLELPLRQLALGVAGVALVASGMFGGLDEVKTPRLPDVGPGAVNPGKPWNVTVTGARLIDEAPPRLRREGDRWIAIRAVVEVTADKSRRDLDDVLELAGVEGLVDKRPAGVYLLRDKASAGALHPGLPEELVFFWEQSSTVPAPSAIEVRIVGKKLRADTLTGRQDWLDKAARARVRLPVDDRRKPS